MSTIIERLQDDHQQILSFIIKFEKELLSLMEDNTFDYSNFINNITFIKEFADKKHHQREEEILFKYLMEHGGLPAEKLVRQGMYVEHDLGRLYVTELLNAVTNYKKEKSILDKLNILSYGHSYCHLLRRHIEKEDTVVYPFAMRILSKEIFDIMEQEDHEYLNDSPQ